MGLELILIESTLGNFYIEYKKLYWILLQTCF